MKHALYQAEKKLTSSLIHTSWSMEKTSAGIHIIIMTLLKKKNSMFVSMYMGSKAILHLCGLFMNMCQLLSVCICMCVWESCQMRKAGRGRGKMVGGAVYLFITRWPWWFQGEGGHGNTCPGPFSAGLFVAFFGSVNAFSFHTPILACLGYFTIHDFFWIQGLCKV